MPKCNKHERGLHQSQPMVAQFSLHNCTKVSEYSISYIPMNPRGSHFASLRRCYDSHRHVHCSHSLAGSLCTFTFLSACPRRYRKARAKSFCARRAGRQFQLFPIPHQPSSRMLQILKRSEHPPPPVSSPAHPSCAIRARLERATSWYYPLLAHISTSTSGRARRVVVWKRYRPLLETAYLRYPLSKDPGTHQNPIAIFFCVDSAWGAP